LGSDGMSNYARIEETYTSSIRRAQTEPMGYIGRDDANGVTQYDDALAPVPKVLQEEANQDLFGDGQRSPQSFRDLVINATGDSKAAGPAQ
jgi:hypothetical protein